MSVTIPFLFTNHQRALADQVNADFQALAAKFTEAAGGITNADISGAAAISAAKFSTIPGSRITSSNMEDNAVDLRVLKSDATAGAPAAAVNTANHIRNSIIAANKLKIVIFSQVIGGNLSQGQHFYDTGLLGANVQALGVYMDNAAVPGLEGQVILNMYRNSLTDHWWIEAYQPLPPPTGSQPVIGTFYFVGISQS